MGSLGGFREAWGLSVHDHLLGFLGPLYPGLYWAGRRVRNGQERVPGLGREPVDMQSCRKEPIGAVLGRIDRHSRPAQHPSPLEIPTPRGALP